MQQLPTEIQIQLFANLCLLYIYVEGTGVK